MLAAGGEFHVQHRFAGAEGVHHAPFDGVDDLLAGPTAIAFINGDVVEAAKGLRDFAKANPLLVIKGGVLEGKVLSADEVKKLADLESRDNLFPDLDFRVWPETGDPAAIGAEMDRIAAEREASQPLRSRTGGSTFKNPDGDRAWSLPSGFFSTKSAISQRQMVIRRY